MPFSCRVCRRGVFQVKPSDCRSKPAWVSCILGLIRSHDHRRQEWRSNRTWAREDLLEGRSFSHPLVVLVCLWEENPIRVQDSVWGELKVRWLVVRCVVVIDIYGVMDGDSGPSLHVWKADLRSADDWVFGSSMVNSLLRQC